MLNNKIVLLEKKTELFAKKAGLKKHPKVKIKRIKGIASASFFNGTITFDEEFISLWEHGVFNDNYIDSVLAHEIGHLIDYGNTMKNRILSYNFKCGILNISYIGVMAILALIINVFKFAIIPLLMLILLFPHYFREWNIKPELEAYKNAVNYKLIDAKILIISRHKTNEYYRRRLKRKSKLHFWKYLFNYFVQPSLTEIAQYIGKEIEFEVKIK